MIAIAPAADDDDDWVDIEKPGKVLAPCVVRVSKKHAHKPARAICIFRDKAAAFFAKATRFRIQIGGDAANRIRFLADDPCGRFEAADLHGSRVLRLGIVTAWPDEARDATAATWRISNGAMIVELPAAWAKPSLPPRPALPPPDEPPKKPESFPITTAAPGLRKGVRVIDRRPEGAVDLGEPPPGRSALDQRRAGR